MSVNDEFDLGMDDEVVLPPLAKPTKKKAARSEPVEEFVAEPAFIDPEDDRENWPTIYIEMEDGKPNYEFVASHGTKKDGSSFGHDLQIMRGVDVQVPPSIVNTLKEMVATHYVPKRGPDGRAFLDRQDRSSIPWKLVRGGKYF